jgi:hypothetical protein
MRDILGTPLGFALVQADASDCTVVASDIQDGTAF